MRHRKLWCGSRKRFNLDRQESHQPSIQDKSHVFSKRCDNKKPCIKHSDSHDRKQRYNARMQTPLQTHTRSCTDTDIRNHTSPISVAACSKNTSTTSGDNVCTQTPRVTSSSTPYTTPGLPSTLRKTATNKNENTINFGRSPVACTTTKHGESVADDTKQKKLGCAVTVVNVANSVPLHARRKRPRQSTATSTWRSDCGTPDPYLTTRCDTHPNHDSALNRDPHPQPHDSPDPSQTPPTPDATLNLHSQPKLKPKPESQPKSKPDPQPQPKPKPNPQLQPNYNADPTINCNFNFFADAGSITKSTGPSITTMNQRKPTTAESRLTAPHMLRKRPCTQAEDGWWVVWDALAVGG